MHFWVFFYPSFSVEKREEKNKIEIKTQTIHCQSQSYFPFGMQFKCFFFFSKLLKIISLYFIFLLLYTVSAVSSRFLSLLFSFFVFSYSFEFLFFPFLCVCIWITLLGKGFVFFFLLCSFLTFKRCRRRINKPTHTYSYAKE